MKTPSYRQWLDDHNQVITRQSAGAEVPCGPCTACCRARQFIQIEADDVDARRVIPRALLFPAPGRPGVSVLGFDERGHCPLFKNDGCSIYPDRPRACRDFDCRVYTAAARYPEDQPEVAAAAQGWSFDLSAEEDRTLQAATQRAGAFLAQHAEATLGTAQPAALRIALAAVKTAGLFIQGEPTPEQVAAALAQ